MEFRCFFLDLLKHGIGSLVGWITGAHGMLMCTILLKTNLCYRVTSIPSIGHRPSLEPLE